MANAAQREKADTGAYLLLTGMVEREDNQYVSICPELGVASCGDTVEEAFAMLAEAVELHLKGLVEIGTLNEELRERNVRVEYEAPPYEYRPRIPVGETNGANGRIYQFFRTPLPA
ncbi:MAG: type II toxin-antitoxin system HicB family antitoxin [Dehalococcoidia bacterium]|nr:type II toxin-antitoxin system HicB family antitoxin [Dehalococcoidia bacterium]